MQKSLIVRLAAGCAGIVALTLGIHPPPAEAGVARAAPAPTPAAGSAVAAAPPVYLPSAGITATEVDFANGDTTLHGSIVRRADLDTSVRHPGVVLVHGSGVGYRAGLTQEAEAFANAGIVALIYDKRGDYSKTHRDFSALADDALAGIRTLRSAANVDPTKVGLWGFSEGGWTAPLAATRSADVRFLITVGGSGLSPARTQAWHLGGRMRHSGVTGATSDVIAGRGVELATGLGLFPAAGYDPAPVLNRVRQPVLAIWGERDVLVPPRESAEIFGRQLTASPSVTLRVLPGASHGGRVTPDGYEMPGGPAIAGFPDGRLTPGYAQLMASWVGAATGGPPPASHSDALPGQRNDSVPLAPVTWFGFAYFGLLLAALLSWPAAAVVRWALGRRGAPPGARPARYLVAAGLVTVIGSAADIIIAVALPGAPGQILFGQPLPWLVLRLVLVGALILVALLARASWRGRATMTRTRRLRVGLLTLGGALLLPYALSIGLLLP